jgi:hypothetical protein
MERELLVSFTAIWRNNSTTHHAWKEKNGEENTIQVTKKALIYKEEEEEDDDIWNFIFVTNFGQISPYDIVVHSNQSLWRGVWVAIAIYTVNAQIITTIAINRAKGYLIYRRLTNSGDIWYFEIFKRIFDEFYNFKTIFRILILENL